MTNRIVRAGVSLAAAILVAGVASAQQAGGGTTVWRSAPVDQRRTAPANWSSSVVPGAKDDVYIPGSAGDCPTQSTFPVLSADDEVQSLTLDRCAVLTINGATLKVAKSLELRGKSQVVLGTGGHLTLEQASTKLFVAESAAIERLEGPSGGIARAQGKAIGRALQNDLGFKATSFSASLQQNGELAVTFKEASSPGTVLSTVNTRLTAGFEQFGASSSPSASFPLVDMMLTAPLTKQTMKSGKHDYTRAAVWLGLDVKGVQQQGYATVKQVATGLADGIVAADSNQSVQGISFRAGIEIKLLNGATTDGASHHYQFEPTLIAGAGAETPLDPTSAAPSVYTLTPQAIKAIQQSRQFTIPSEGNYAYIAFVPPNRSRFFRNVFAGFRLKSHHFDCPAGEPSCSPSQRKEVNFPGEIDVTWGYDEAVTGGRFSHSVIKLEGFYPFPSETLANSLYIFGAMYLGLGKSQNSPPLFMPLAPSTVSVSDPDVYVDTLTADQMSRDDWKIGIAVDLISLVKSFSGSGKSGSNSATP